MDHTEPPLTDDMVCELMAERQTAAAHRVVVLRLEAARRARCMDRKDLARALGITRQHIDRMLDPRESYPDTGHVRAAADLLGVRLSVL